MIKQVFNTLSKNITQTKKIAQPVSAYKFCADASDSVWDRSRKNSVKDELISVEAALEKYLPEETLQEVNRIIYGNPAQKINIPSSAQKIAEENDFVIQGYSIKAEKFQQKKQRIVRVGAVQNSIKAPTTATVLEQQEALREWMTKVVEAAHLCGVNVLCTQELWTGPFFPATREMKPWLEFAEDIQEGPTAKLLSDLAKQYNMVIVNSVLEKDPITTNIHNTVSVISNRGEYLGRHHKNHIPRVGDFNESTYYMEGETGHPVFETEFGKIAANICYGRHFPQNWMMFALNGAEIIVNPSATIGGLSEPLWPVEARNAAIANHCFTVAINRVGTEHFPNEFTSGDGNKAHKDFGLFYGSSYIAAPDGSRTPGLPRVKDGLLVTELDLNMCQQINEKWKFRMCGRYPLYEQGLKAYNSRGFKPQIIKNNN